MQEINYRTVEVPSQSILVVVGHISFCDLRNSHELSMSPSHLINRTLGRQIKAKAKINDGSYDRWILDRTAVAASELLGKIDAALGILLPEVDPATEPIILVLARLKRIAR